MDDDKCHPSTREKGIEGVPEPPNVLRIRASCPTVRTAGSSAIRSLLANQPDIFPAIDARGNKWRMIVRGAKGSGLAGARSGDE